MQNKHLGYAFLTKKLSSFNYLEGKLFARDAGAYSFYSNPLNDGESILSKMVMNNAIFSKHLFIAAYEVMDNH